MSIQNTINAYTEALQNILNSSNSALSAKGVASVENLKAVPNAISRIITSGTTISLQAKNATPTGQEFVVTPDAGYNGLSQVTVAGDNNLKSDNIANGITIYGVTGTLVPKVVVDKGYITVASEDDLPTDAADGTIAVVEG